MQRRLKRATGQSASRYAHLSIRRGADGVNMAKNNTTGGTRESIRTIGDWQPSVLLLDFKLVPETLRLCFLGAVHRVVVVGRVDGHSSILFNVLGHGPMHLLWSG
jgi:hypothetical protein